MKRFLLAPVVAILLITSCETNPLPNLPVQYHNSEYDFTFYLPHDWQRFSVLNDKWEGTAYIPAKDDTEIVEHGPIILLRHPQWTTNAPRQDIPIMVFTRKQWDELWQTNGFSTSAGGVDFEIAHNSNYVFAVHSRFDWSELPGFEEAGKTVDENADANKPHLRDY